MAAILADLRMIVLWLFGGTFTPGTGDPIVYSGVVSQVVTFITANPLVLIFTILPLCGLGIGVFKRLVK